MLKGGIVNPAINSLLSRIRHTNMLVIADRNFPFWPAIETVDLSLVDDIPRVLDVLHPIREVFDVGKFAMAEEFRLANSEPVVQEWISAMKGVDVVFEPHVEFKRRVPRTDTDSRYHALCERPSSVRRVMPPAETVFLEI